MKLRTKTIIIVFFSLIILVGALTILSQSVLLKGFAKVEDEDVNDKSKLVLEAIRAMELGLVSKAADWGAWDDAYEYVQRKNKKFEDSNFADNSLPNLKVDAVAYYDVQGKPVKEVAYSLENEKAVDFYSDLKNYLKPNSPLLTHSGPEDEKSGILMLKEGPMLFVARPVTDSEAIKSIKGTVFFGKLLSPKQIKILSETTQLKVSQYFLSQSDLPKDVAWSKSVLSIEKKTTAQIQSDNEINGYALLEDYFKKPSLILKIETERGIFAEGRDSLNTMLWSIAGLVFIFGLMLIFLLEKYLVRRLTQMTQEISYIKNDQSQRLQVNGHDEISTLGNQMNHMLQSIEINTQEIKSAHKTIGTMLNSLGQGFFVFDKTGLVDKNYSLACELLLECVPSNKYLFEVIRYSEEDCKEWLEQLFLELITFESMSELGPKFYPHSKGLHIGLSYYPVRDEQQKLIQVVCIATDLTEEMKAKTELLVQKSYVERIVKMVKNKNEFITFVNETRRIILFCEEELKKNKPDISSLFRSIHTIKGGAGAFSLIQVQDFAHDFESQLGQLRTISPIILESKIKELNLNLIKLKALFETTLSDNKEILGQSIIDGDKRIEIAFAQVKKFYSLISQSAPYKTLEYEFLNEFISQPIVKSFEYYNEVLQSLAGRLGKSVQPIEFVGGQIPIIHEHYSELFTTLIHALRNSVDHGIETPDEREEIGKSREGHIHVKFSKVTDKNKDYLSIELIDDGRGIDLEKIRAKSNASNQNTAELTEEQLLNKIFESGFSTADRITETSGRGVGLDAINSICLKLGGSCEVKTENKKGTSIKVKVPFVYQTYFKTNDVKILS